MAKAYWIASIEVSDFEAYKNYIAEAQHAFRKYGARYVARGGKSEVLEGQGRPRIVVVEFDDYATAVACYRSPEFAKAIAKRRSNAVADMVVVEGYEGPQPLEGAEWNGA